MGKKSRIHVTKFSLSRKFRRTVKTNLPTLLDAAFVEMPNELNQEASTLKTLFDNAYPFDAAHASSVQVR